MDIKNALGAIVLPASRWTAFALATKSSEQVDNVASGSSLCSAGAERMWHSH